MKKLNAFKYVYSLLTNQNFISKEKINREHSSRLLATLLQPLNLSLKQVISR